MQATKNALRKVWTFVSNLIIAVVAVPFSLMMGIVVGTVAGLASFMGSVIVSLTMGISVSIRRMEKALGKTNTDPHTTAQIFDFKPAVV